MKKIKLILFAFLILLFANCEREEAITDAENKTSSISLSKIPFSTVNKEINALKIKNILECKSFYTLNNDTFSRTNSTEPTFTKIQKKDSLTTYVLNLNSYTVQKPYFLKLIITKNINETEKMGYLKYIPTNPSTTLDLTTFSGEIQVLDSNFEVTASSKYINGVKQIRNQNNGNSNRTVCTNEIVITEQKCSHSGTHGVGQSCSNGLVNDAHYVVSVFTRCTTRGDQLVQIIEDTGSANNGTGGVYPATIFLNPFIDSLSEDEKAIYYTNPSIQEYLVNNLIKEEIPNYNSLLGGDPNIVIVKPEALEFVNELIDRSNETGLTFDVEKSSKSPAFIDFTEIDTTTTEGKKFDCIYKNLAQSPSFKNLFIDTFGGTQEKLNIKFEIADNLPAETNGNCTLSSSNGNYTNLIRINKNKLSGTDELSNFLIAKTILHECIHAYLNIKKINCALGTTIPELNGLDLQSLIGTFYQGFGCHINVNGSPQSQHDFMFNYLIPVFQTVFSETRDLLTSQANIDYVETGDYTNTVTGTQYSWNWNDFYKYFSLEGLHLCDSFTQNISQVANENFYYNFYKEEARSFSKTCQ